jgi:ADP-ribosylglycohydrolase
VGDALGAPVEFLEWNAIRATFGAQGIVDYASAYARLGAITDDTQMMLFTAEGLLLRAYVRGSSRGICNVPSVIHHALLRWLITHDYRGHPRQSRWLVATRACIVVSPRAR